MEISRKGVIIIGVPVLIMGASGSGKSASLRNFDPAEIGIFNVASKPLPFRKQLPLVNKATYGIIQAGLKKNNLHCYVIDDSQYLMAFEQVAKAKEAGYGKYTDMGTNFINLVQFVILNTSPDTIVYFLHHAEQTELGKIKAKTVGKLIDNWLTLEGMFSIVLLAETDGKEHWFATQSDGYSTAKSPMDMFPEKIPNDLKLVDKTIREYYEFGGKTDEKD